MDFLDRAPSLTLPQFAKYAFIRRRIGVYAWKRGDQFLYIGSSNNLLSRITYNHHVIGVKEAFLEDDDLHIWLCTNLKEARLLEGAMMGKFRPKYNATYPKSAAGFIYNCKKCGKEFKQKRAWHTYCSSACRDYYESPNEDEMLRRFPGGVDMYTFNAYREWEERMMLLPNPKNLETWKGMNEEQQLDRLRQIKAEDKIRELYP